MSAYFRALLTERLVCELVLHVANSALQRLRFKEFRMNFFSVFIKKICTSS